MDPYEVFTTKKAVCGGFSRLYKAMLNLAGIPAVKLPETHRMERTNGILYMQIKNGFILIVHGVPAAWIISIKH